MRRLESRQRNDIRKRRIAELYLEGNVEEAKKLKREEFFEDLPYMLVYVVVIVFLITRILVLK